MTTETLNVPAHIAKRIEARQSNQSAQSALAAALAGAPQPPRIGTRASRFRLIEGGVETVVGPELDVVIVGANPNSSKIFFEDDYTEGVNVQPTCASADGKHPDANISSPVSSACASCPNNVLGSKITPSGAKSKLCGDVRYLAVVPAADPKKIYALYVTVTAMKGLREYAQGLSNYGILPEEVVTHLSFDDQASYPKIEFSRGDFLPEAAINMVASLQETPEVAEAIRTDVQPALPAPDAPAAEAPKADNVAKLPTAKTEAANAFSDAAEEPVAEEPAPAEEAAAAAQESAPVEEKAPSDEATVEDSTALEKELDSIFG